MRAVQNALFLSCTDKDESVFQCPNGVIKINKKCTDVSTDVACFLLPKEDFQSNAYIVPDSSNGSHAENNPIASFWNSLTAKV